jgi:rubrerythrin
LAAVEEKHQALLQKAWLGLEPRPGTQEHLTTTASGQVLEGGFKFDEFIRENEPRLTTATAILELALMLETQALDLYLRFADREGEGATKNILYRLADEEKVHLAALGRLLDSKSD